MVDGSMITGPLGGHPGMPGQAGGGAMPRPVHFEIHAENPERAIAFYRSLFGWTFEKWGNEAYWVVSTGDKNSPGIDGGLVQRRGPGPADMQAVNAFVCTVDVADVDGYLARATEHGGSVALPKMPVPTVGWLGYAKDTEGNLFGVIQFDPGAK
jgi:predicted enzyme related to lactoylglutathione lyase